MIPGKLTRFLDDQANLGIAGTRDRALVPQVHRVSGWRVGDDPRILSAYVVDPTPDALLADLEDNGRFALTIEQYPSHETYQFKGRYAGRGPIGPAELARVSAARHRFVHGVRTLFPEAPESILGSYIGDPTLEIRFEVEAIFQQTPGPGAGARLVPPPDARGVEPAAAEPAPMPIPAREAAPPARLPEDIRPALENGIPAIMVTCSAAGIPNATIISQVYWVDESHVALSFQFFNKTIRNVRENPRAAVRVNDLMRLQQWILDLEFEHSETDGPIFDTMEMQIEAIASATGMSGIFKLRAADLYRVRSVRRMSFVPPAGA